MALKEDIESIRSGLAGGRFVSEADVCHGIVLRLLSALNWPTFETLVVSPEFSLGGRRVDFALCHPPRKPVAFIEVKKPGQSDGAERQLFEYAFHEGVPLAILTDGQEWNFFLPGEQGNYGERRVYKLDLVERDVGECADRLVRYLSFARISSGQALQAAREDYRDVAKMRQIATAFPEAWRRLISDEDELLIELLADKVESVCGYKPDPDSVAAFLRDTLTATRGPAVDVRPPKPPVSVPEPPILIAPTPAGKVGLYLDGKFHSASHAIDVLKQTLELFGREDASFLERFAAAPKHGRTRRYLARSRDELYTRRPDLCQEYAAPIAGNWWMSTNHSRNTIKKIIEKAIKISSINPSRFRYTFGE